MEELLARTLSNDVAIRKPAEKELLAALENAESGLLSLADVMVNGQQPQVTGTASARAEPALSTPKIPTKSRSLTVVPVTALHPHAPSARRPPSFRLALSALQPASSTGPWHRCCCGDTRLTTRTRPSHATSP